MADESKSKPDGTADQILEGSNVRLHHATGYRPIREKEILNLERMIADAKEGKVTAFAWAAVGSDFSLWVDWTLMTRQDRMNLIGQLQTMIAQLVKTEETSW